MLAQDQGLHAWGEDVELCKLGMEIWDALYGKPRERRGMRSDTGSSRKRQNGTLSGFLANRKLKLAKCQEGQPVVTGTTTDMTRVMSEALHASKETWSADSSVSKELKFQLDKGDKKKLEALATRALAPGECTPGEQERAEQWKRETAQKDRQRINKSARLAEITTSIDTPMDLASVVGRLHMSGGSPLYLVAILCLGALQMIRASGFLFANV